MIVAIGIALAIGIEIETTVATGYAVIPSLRGTPPQVAAA